ncbi:hypothetical protein BGX38DRAFT_1274832 [Terfezia claveryi]|nr:hypothetical protein BGX38DRAFT_1274832 [Terfezia claveryi]
MPDHPQKKSKTTGKAPASPAPESAMQKKKSTREGPASSAGKRLELIQKEGMTTRKAPAAQTTEHKKEDKSRTSPSPPPVEDVPTRRRTRAELAFYPPPIADVPRTRTAELTEDVPKKRNTSAGLAIPSPRNLYAKYANFPWGSREFNPDTEFSGGGMHGHFHQSPHEKNSRDHKKLLGPPLSWERAKDWKRQKVNRETSKELSKGHGPMFIRKRAYILYQWYQLSDDQKRLYLELEEQQELPDFQIPNGELEAIGVKPVQQFTPTPLVTTPDPGATRNTGANITSDTGANKTSDKGPNVPEGQMLTIQEELAEGGADDCLSDEDIGTDIEEDCDDKRNKQDDDEDTGLWGRWEASEGSTKEEEAQLTESDSSKRGKGLLVPGRDRPTEFLPSGTEDEDYSDSTEEDDTEVNKRVYRRILRRGTAMTTTKNNQEDKGEKQVAGDNGGKDEREDADEEEGEDEDKAD